jgi:uncharacterized protein YggU (UPF0235/DUF167 family)
MQIQIKVKTKQKTSNLELNENKEYVALVKSMPTKDKANYEVLDLVAEYFGVSRNQVTIKSGKHSHLKTVYIDE